jgi:hypothetical protein
MTLIDKFGILNQSSQNDKIRIDSIIDNYLENIIINNDYVLSPNIVHKNIWEIVNLRKSMTNENIKNIFIEKLDKYFSSYLKIKRREIKRGIKKGNFELVNLNEMIQSFMNSIIKYKNSFSLIDLQSSGDNKKSNYYGQSIFYNSGIKQFCILIISDPIISSIIKKNINEFTKNSINELRIFNSNIQKFNDYYNISEWFCSYIDNVLIDNIPKHDYELNKDFLNLYRFSDVCSYRNLISKKFYFLDKIVFKGIDKEINKKFFEIITLDKNSKFESIDYIITFFENYKNFLRKIIFKRNPDIIYDVLSIFDKLYSFSSNKMLNLKKIIKFSEIIYKFKIKSCTDVLDNKLKKYFSTDDDVINFVNIIHFYIVRNFKNIDYNLLNNNQQEPFIFDNICKIKDKHNFINEYSKKMIIRLIDFKEKSDFDIILLEEYYCSLIEKFINVSRINYTFKLKKIIYDFKLSSRMINDYYELLNRNSIVTIEKNYFDCLITSYDNWNINITDGFTKKFNNVFPDKAEYYNEYCKNLVYKILMKYGYFYNESYSDTRDLYFLLHLGKIEIYFNTNIKKVLLSMLPIQAIIIGIFMEKSKDITFESIIKYLQKITNYSRKILISSIKSLLNTKILINKNEDENKEQNIIVNMDFYCDEDILDISKYFFDISDVQENTKKIVEDKLCHEREDILNSVLNSIIKKNPNKKFLELKELIDKNFNFFAVSNDLIKKCLDSMVKNEYISCDDGRYQKLFY